MEIFNDINIQNKESYELRKEKIILSFKKIFANKKPIKLENFDFVLFKSNLYKEFNEIFFKKINVYALINNNEININKLDEIIFTNFIEYWNLSTKIEKDENDKTIYNYPELNGHLNTLKTMIKEYYNSEIVPFLFEYEFLK